MKKDNLKDKTLKGLINKFSLIVRNSWIRLGYFINKRTSLINALTLQGGAFLVGPVDDETEEFSGRNVLYLYPDLKSAICGRFDSKYYSNNI